MGVIAGIFEILTVLGGIVGGLVMGWTLLSLGAGQGSDITIAAASAFAVAVTAIPYCIAGVCHRAETRGLMRQRG